MMKPLRQGALGVVPGSAVASAVGSGCDGGPTLGCNGATTLGMALGGTGCGSGCNGAATLRHGATTLGATTLGCTLPTRFASAATTPLGITALPCGLT